MNCYASTSIMFCVSMKTEVYSLKKIIGIHMNDVNISNVELYYLFREYILAFQYSKCIC